MNKNTLISWIGMTDLDLCKSSGSTPLGPIAQAITTFTFDEIYLLSNFDSNTNILYTNWLEQFTSSPIIVTKSTLSSPMNFEGIYTATTSVCKNIINSTDSSQKLVYHISPGTSAMAAVFILIAKTLYPGKIIQSSLAYGVEEVTIPFDISVDFIPKLLEKQDYRFENISSKEPVDSLSFDSIIHRSREMYSMIRLAKKASFRSIPILIEGESGTGKELFARAIHQASPRKDKPFIVVNCGALPQELFESELFGYEKGAFTGAGKRKIGIFESAHQGTVFLDEIGELPIFQQVKLLRTLQEKSIRRVGGIEEVPVDVRIIAATNKDLLDEVKNSKFREDLYYRLAIAIIKIPALRNRQGDLSLLIDHFMHTINLEYSVDPGYFPKKLSANAKQTLYEHSWPGNIRELINTLRRAILWSDNETISREDIDMSLTSGVQEKNVVHYDYENLMQQKNFIFDEQINQVVQEWISTALKLTNGNKSKAAVYLGLNNYQTLSNWIKRINMN